MPYHHGLYSMPLEAGLFRAKDNITRGEVCKALVNFAADKEALTETTTKSVEATTKTGSTDKTTETTTKKTSSSGGGGGSSSSGSSGSSSSGSSGSSSSATTTEATTEATTEVQNSGDITLTDAQMSALDNVIRTTKNVVILRLNNENLKDIARFVLNAMESYYADPSYDIVSDGQTVRNMYNDLSPDDRSEFQRVVTASYDMADVNELLDVFGPLLGI